MSAGLDELKEALRQTLDARGVIRQLKAKVRSEVFAALDDEHAQRPTLPRENVIINELIREYLEFNGYHHTVSVFLPESGHPEERQFDRPFLASELFLEEDERSRSLPLLYGLTKGLHRRRTESVPRTWSGDPPLPRQGPPTSASLQPWQQAGTKSRGVSRAYTDRDAGNEGEETGRGGLAAMSAAAAAATTSAFARAKAPTESKAGGHVLDARRPTEPLAGSPNSVLEGPLPSHSTFDMPPPLAPPLPAPASEFLDGGMEQPDPLLIRVEVIGENRQDSREPHFFGGRRSAFKDSGKAFSVLKASGVRVSTIEGSCRQNLGVSRQHLRV